VLPDSFFGLPLHPLVVHATVVVVPAAAVAVLLAAVWPRFRRWAGWGPLALSVAAVVLAPLSTSTGETFQERFGGGNPAIEEHAELGDQLLWWVIGLAVLAAALFWWHRRTTGERSRAVGAAITVLPVLVALGTLVMVALIGHSGAQAAWG
jgi:Kef-type K+ transport system membrane component KefB